MKREIAFAVHVGPAKLAARTLLTCKRHILSRAEPLAKLAWPSDAPVPLNTNPPAPIFAPRSGRIEATADGYRFVFVGASRELRHPIDWRRPEPRRATLWQLNLHYMEYLEAVDDRHFGALGDDWIRANPPLMDHYWLGGWNSYALSIRTVVWMQQLALRAPRLDAALRDRMVSSLSQQLRFLEANLEVDLGGNHLVKNMKALLWASAFFEGADANRWRKAGLELLLRILGRQILADGTHEERSASYHAQVFADLLECRHALGEDPLNGRLDNALERMAQVVADLTHPDGGPVLFNDAGLTMAYSPTDCLDVYKRLFGQQPSPRVVFSLKDAGYFGFAAGGTYLVADCGRIAPDDLPAHGHGDVLSFEWSVHGQRIIVDQGVYEYNAGKRREQARTASSHNTLCFEAADQADFFSSFRCGRRPDVEVLSYEECSDGFELEGTHDGFCNLPGRPRHFRRLMVRQGRLILRDRIEGRTQGHARITLLLHPEIDVQLAGLTATLKQRRTSITMRADLTIESESAVWWPDMGVERKTRRLVLRVPPDVRLVTTELTVDPV